jgi:transcriptional regulator with XRE-family HTH domain
MLTADDTELISQNARLLLWQRQVPRSDWVRHLANKLPPIWGGQNVSRVLNGYEVGNLNFCDIAIALEIEEEQLRWEDLLTTSAIDVMKENLSYLLGSLEHGGKKKVAADLGIDPTTVSRWLSGAITPQSGTLKRISNYFGLTAETDLSSSAVFLSLEPVSLPERRQWLNQRIEALSANELRELYPALQRMLGPV